MSPTVQFLQQPPSALATTETGAATASAPLRIARGEPVPRRAMRIRASAPSMPPTPPGAAPARPMSAAMPYRGRSALHTRIHTNNVAAVGNMLELQKQTLELSQQTGLLIQQSAILREQTHAQSRIADATDIISRRLPDPSDPTFDPALNDAKFSLIADVVAVAAHLMDKRDVDADSFLENKLRENTASLIHEVRSLLAGYQLQDALDKFNLAVDDRSFEQLVSCLDPSSPAVYAEINRRAGYLLATMLTIATADFGTGISPGDWPSPPDDDGGGIDSGPPSIAAAPPAAQVQTVKAKAAKAQAPKARATKARTAKAEAAPAGGSAPKATAKRARKTAPRNER